MLRRLRSKTYYAAKRAVHATLLRFDLELNRAGTREQLKRERKKARELESTLAGLQKQPERELEEAKELESKGAGGWEQLEESQPPKQRKEQTKGEWEVLREEIESKRHELAQMNWQYRGGTNGLREWKKIQQEIFELKMKLRAAQEGTISEPQTGALPDFVVIGAAKSGTTSFYHLLTKHPLVGRAAAKELRFFDALFDEGVEWYRRCFPRPRLKDGRKTITGEGTPNYLFHPHTPERMAEMVPQARLIALLRNPVDRAYSHYQMMVRRGFETRGFEEAVEVEEERLRGERDEMLENEQYVSIEEHQNLFYLARGLYVDQLSRWSEFFSQEQMLVLKSEDFFKRPVDAFRLVLDFLGLPDWQPESWEVRKKADKYQQKMEPVTRRRLEEFFEPHNQRLYNFLGKDFGW